MTVESSSGSTAIPREIERKFLLSAVPPRVLGERPVTMAQGYVPGTNIHERLRRESGDEGERLVRTIKLGRGIERIEVEEEVDASLFARLWALTEGARVEKQRYRIAEGDLVFEVDVFTDRELVLAEVELPSVDTAVPLPEWLAPYVVRDVTDDPTYLNLRLAR